MCSLHTFAVRLFSVDVWRGRLVMAVCTPVECNVFAVAHCITRKGILCTHYCGLPFQGLGMFVEVTFRFLDGIYCCKLKSGHCFFSKAFQRSSCVHSCIWCAPVFTKKHSSSHYAVQGHVLFLHTMFSDVLYMTQSVFVVYFFIFIL